MTGPEHYQYAEVAQEAAAAMQANRPGGPDYTPTEALIDALVHATLALAAATALGIGAPPGMSTPGGWTELVDPPPEGGHQAQMGGF